MAKGSPSAYAFTPGLLLIGLGVGVMLTPSVNVVQSSFPEEPRVCPMAERGRQRVAGRPRCNGVESPWRQHRGRTGRCGHARGPARCQPDLRNDAPPPRSHPLLWARSHRSERVNPKDLRSFLTDRARHWDRSEWQRWALTFAVIRPNGEPLAAQVEWGPDRIGSTVAPLDLSGGRLCFNCTDLAASVEEGVLAPPAESTRTP